MDLFVGNLPLEVDGEALKNLIGTYVPVEKARVIYQNGVSRGFGFVTVAENDAPTVIQKANGQLLGDKKIVVKNAFRKSKPPVRVIFSKKWREKAAEKV